MADHGYDAKPMLLTVLDLCRPDHTLEVAPHVEELGFERYWMTTHLGAGAYSASTEIMSALVGGMTQRIRFGSAGIPLLYQSPLQVAANFRMLAAMFPDRVDLGVIRVPGVSSGGSTPVKDAIRSLLADGRTLGNFDERVEVLRGLTYGFPEGHPYAEVPVPPPVADDEDFVPPAMWVLGSSLDSAKLAARLGLSYSFSEFIGTREVGVAAVATYTELFQPSPWLAEPEWSICVSGCCADDEAVARQVVESFGGVGHAAKTPPLFGNPEQCARFLSELQRAYGNTELVFADLSEDLDVKLRSYELMAEAVNLSAARAERDR